MNRCLWFSSTVALQQEGPGFVSGPGSFCVEFACSRHVCRYSRYSQASKDICVSLNRLLWDWGVYIGGRVNLSVCVWLFVLSALCPGCLSPVSAEMGSCPP